MAGAIEPVGLGEDLPCLVPGALQEGIAAVPVEETQRVVGCGAVRSGVAQPDVITMVQGL